MGYLRGLATYLKENYRRDLFSEFQQQGEILDFHLHGHKILRGRIVKNIKYDVLIRDLQDKVHKIPKVHIKLLYPAEVAAQLLPFIQIDEQVKARNFQPIFNPTRRYHVKNKSLYPMMMLKKPIAFTLLEGEQLQGLISDFTLYEIILQPQPGLEFIVLRHAIYQCSDPETGRNLLKKFQDQAKDWQNTPLWVEDGTED